MWSLHSTACILHYITVNVLRLHHYVIDAISGIVTDDYKVQGMNKLPFEISPNFLYVNPVFGRRRRSINQPLSLCWATACASY